MRDRTDTLRADAPPIDTRVLRHMLVETTDLLDETSAHAAQGARSTEAAMALTRADATLLSVFAWLSCQLRYGADASEPLASALIALDIAPESLGNDLSRYVERVDRLHARAGQLQSLVQEPFEAPRPVEANREGQVLHIFGDLDSEAISENPVRLARQRLHWAFGGR